jgi:hypothetical protein
MSRLAVDPLEDHAVRAMHRRAPMISTKNIDKILKGAIAAMPAIPYITKRRSSMVLPLVLGGIGVALMGGMAAVMFLSPRTRYRAMDMAKNTYGKINTQIGTQLAHLRSKGSEEASVSNGLANGMSDQNGIGTGYSTTGL